MHLQSDRLRQHALCFPHFKSVLEQAPVVSISVEPSIPVNGNGGLAKLKTVLLDMQYRQFRCYSIYDVGNAKGFHRNSVPRNEDPKTYDECWPYLVTNGCLP